MPMKALDGHYCGEALRAVSMPLGGLGTGSIALAGDGSLRQWQIHNQINHMACLPQSFFAVWSRTLREPLQTVAMVLQSNALYDHDGTAPPPTANDHLVPAAHRSLLAQLPGVQTTEFTGKYPIAAIRYSDPDLPLDVSLEAFNPFIPLNAKDSGIPAILFEFTIANPTDVVMLASIAATLQNAVGWDGVSAVTANRCVQYGGNANSLLKGSEHTTVLMGNSWLRDDDPRYGSMALMVDTVDATYLTQWADEQLLWSDFSDDGQLANIADATVSAAGSTWSGALAAPLALQPGESKTVTFVIAWHFPNRFVNYSQMRYFKFPDDRSKFYLGNQYNNWFKSASDVVTYVLAERARLSHQTRLAGGTFYDTSLPYALIDAVTSQMSIARSPTCFWIENGSFFGFEGCNGASTGHIEQVGGSCPLNCTHVWNYEMALARLFPGLERSMRDTEWDIQQHPSGYLPHRVLLPTYLPRPWDQPMGGPLNPALDGLMGAILKTYREFLASGDQDWLDHHWPAVKHAMEHLWTVHDPELSGVIEGEQPNTYDISIYGANTFIGTLYLAALRAVEELAIRLDDQSLASNCREVFDRGQSNIEQRLWNGSFYIQDVDFERHPLQNWGIGCHSDQLLGQWWAHRLGLGHLLDPDRVKTAARAIVEHNFCESFVGFDPPVQTRQLTRHFVIGEDQGLMLCTWPNGGRPEVPTQYSDEVWTGIEYEVAALLIDEGETELGLKLVEAVRRRYDGTKQNPWNDIECGDHYVRAMSSWSLLEAASGYFYDASTGSIAFDPKLNPEAFRAPFVARDGWGKFSQRYDDNVQEVAIHLAYGNLHLKQLSIKPHVNANTVTAECSGKTVKIEVRQGDSKLVLEFEKQLLIPTGEMLTVTVNSA